MEAFSDGVFAIAITLLVFQIAVPEAAFGNLWRGIADQWPSYLAYATSFLTIGGLWMVHHGVFRRMHHANLTVMRTNLLLLMTVAFLPFPTRLVAQAISRTSAERPAALFYGLTLLAISVISTVMLRYVATRPELRLERSRRSNWKHCRGAQSPVWPSTRSSSSHCCCPTLLRSRSC